MCDCVRACVFCDGVCACVRACVCVCDGVFCDDVCVCDVFRVGCVSAA